MKLVVGRERNSFERGPERAVGSQWVHCIVDIDTLNR